MELLYQSNPSLIPMRQFDLEMYVNHHYEINQDDKDNEENQNENENNGEDKFIDLGINDSHNNEIQENHHDDQSLIPNMILTPNQASNTVTSTHHSDKPGRITPAPSNVTSMRLLANQDSGEEEEHIIIDFVEKDEEEQEQPTIIEPIDAMIMETEKSHSPFSKSNNLIKHLQHKLNNNI